MERTGKVMERRALVAVLEWRYCLPVEHDECFVDAAYERVEQHGGEHVAVGGACPGQKVVGLLLITQAWSDCGFPIPHTPADSSGADPALTRSTCGARAERRPRLQARADDKSISARYCSRLFVVTPKGCHISQRLRG